MDPMDISARTGLLRVLEEAIGYWLLVIILELLGQLETWSPNFRFQVLVSQPVTNGFVQNQ